MKKHLLLSMLFATMVTASALAQVSFEANNYPEAGDEFSMITYSNNPGAEAVLLRDFFDGNFVFNSMEMFAEFSVDTIFYLNPEDVDTANNYPNAHLCLRDGVQDFYLIKSNDNVSAIGFDGDMFGMGMNFPIVADSPLKLMEFPTNTDTNFEDSTHGEYKMPIEALQEMIPPDNYETFASIFDSVKVILDVKGIHEVLSELDVTINLGSVDNGTFDCLQEFETNITTVDILLRYRMNGSWASLGDIPGIGDQLPMELPFIDTTHTFNLWTPDYGYPLVTVETEPSFDTVFSIKFHYNGQSSVTAFNQDRFSVYPNPATEKINVNLTDVKREIRSIQVLNSQGKLEKEFAVTETFFSFACSELAAGWYIIQLMDETNQAVGSQKIVIQGK
jgi:hypothetical protein